MGSQTKAMDNSVCSSSSGGGGAGGSFVCSKTRRNDQRHTFACALQFDRSKDPTP